MRMLRLRSFEVKAEDEEVQRERLQKAQLRLRRLDIQADIIARRSGKTHE